MGMGSPGKHLTGLSGAGTAKTEASQHQAHPRPWAQEIRGQTAAALPAPCTLCLP